MKLIEKLAVRVPRRVGTMKEMRKMLAEYAEAEVKKHKIPEERIRRAFGGGFTKGSITGIAVKKGPPPMGSGLGTLGQKRRERLLARKRK